MWWKDARDRSAADTVGRAILETLTALDTLLPRLRVQAVATPPAHGSVAPAEQTVRYGDAATVSLTAAQHHHAEAIYTNGVPAPLAGHPSAATFVWPSVTAAGEVAVTFAPNLTATGTPEWWLAAHGLTNGGFEAAAAADSDKDGAVNWMEQRAGTDPTNAVSVLRLTGCDATAGGAMVLHWLSASNRVYDVLAGSNLPSVYTPVGSNLAATPPLNVYTAAVPAACSPLYYRIRLRTGLE